MADGGLTRRNFLKMLSAGLGLGFIASLNSVSALKLTKDSLNGASSIDTGSLDVTNQTFIGTYSTTQTTVPSSTWTNIVFDTVEKDVLNEYNASNGEFVPQETGYYRVTVQARFQLSTTDERIFLKLHNLDDGVTEIYTKRHSRVDHDYDVAVSRNLELEAGKSYRIEVNSVFNEQSVEGNKTATYLNIERLYI